MKILVTGATGFIGRYVVERLLETPHEIIATSLEETASLVCRYVPADLNETGIAWFERFERPDSVIHLAWEGLPNYNELFHIERNMPTAYHFLKNMAECGVKDINVVGTCFEYGLQEGWVPIIKPRKSSGGPPNFR